MKFSENTISIIKNFATINPGLYFRKGNVLRTVSKGKNILAEATIDETIPSDFGIAELNQLLSILSIHPQPPELIIGKTGITITGLDGRNKISYRCCDETQVKNPPTQNCEALTPDASFLLTEKDLAWVQKTASVLGSPNIAVVGAKGVMSLRTLDSHDDAQATNTLEVSPWVGDDFMFVFKTENWKFIPGSYVVTMSLNPGAGHFQHQARKLQYWVAIEASGK
jgi:hypothetical protein